MPDFELPAGFRFGVATAGFQIEGGYNAGTYRRVIERLRAGDTSLVR